MKRTILLLLLMPALGFSQTEDSAFLTIQATMPAATVYYGFGAELTHQAKGNLKKGVQQILIQNISTSADIKTLQVAIPASTVLLSQQYAVVNTTKPWVKDVFYKKMEDSLALIQKDLSLMRVNLQNNTIMTQKVTSLLESAAGGGKETSANDIIKLTDYYQSKIEELQEKARQINEKSDLLVARTNALQISMQNYISGKQIPGIKTGQLQLQLQTEKAGPVEMSFSYFSPNAGWVASYDMRIQNNENEFKLGYRAAVQQTTGIDWKQAKLTLSTSNPNVSNTMPLLSAWYLQPQVKESLSNTLSGRVPGIDVKQINSLNEVVVVGYEKRSMDDYEKDKLPETEKPSYLDTYLNLKESQLNTNFEIDLPYDIPADGKPYTVAIKEENVKAGFKHYAVPKLDTDAFLVAEIADWESLSLLPGEANIIMDNIYLGKSFIDPNNTADTMSISLGRDKRVSIKRVLVKDDNKNKQRGDSKHEYFTYELVVKNNKKQAMNILLKDQYPMSNTKEIEVKVEEDGNANINKDLGVLNWKISLEPGESKKIRFGYSIKYPKDLQLVIR